MGRLRISRRTTWFGILAFLVATLGGVDGKVFCVGDDGHIALETVGLHASYPSVAISVKNGSSSGERQTAGIAPCCTHCGPCTDIPALSMDVVRNPTRISPVFPVAHPVAISPAASSFLVDLASLESILYETGRVPTPDPTPRSLRSTVLLI